MSSHPARGAPHVLVGTVALSLALGGCGVRFDTPPPPLPTADAAEAARQAAALRAERIATLAENLAEQAREELAAIAADSRAHAAALGGTWSPPDWATTTGPSDVPGLAPTPSAPGLPTPQPTPSAEPAPPTAADVAEALAASATLTCADAARLDMARLDDQQGDAEAGEAARSSSDQAGAQRPDGDPATTATPGGAGDLITLLASICLAQRQRAAELGMAVGDLPGRPAASARPTLVAAALADSAGAPALARALDAAGYALEVVAARSAGTTRSALAARARDHRDLAREVLDAAGALGAPGDPRRAAYSLDKPGALDPGAIEAQVLAAWTAAVASAPPAERSAILAEMEATAALARDWGAPPSTFPGLR